MMKTDFHRTSWADMTPRERDALVAEKIMGWLTCRDLSCVGCNANVMLVRRQRSPDTVWSIRHPVTLQLGWSPITNIAHAWEVVEKMHEGRWNVLIQLFTPGVVVEFFDYESPLDDKQDVGIAAVDPREGGVPYAICLAALRAKGIDV